VEHIDFTLLYVFYQLHYFIRENNISVNHSFISPTCPPCQKSDQWKHLEYCSILWDHPLLLLLQDCTKLLHSTVWTHFDCHDYLWPCIQIFNLFDCSRLFYCKEGSCICFKSWFYFWANGAKEKTEACGSFSLCSCC